MPTRSRNARTKARQKRSMSLLKRGYKEAAFAANRNHATILMLLAQAGGDVFIPEETLQTLPGMIAKVQYQIDPVDEMLQDVNGDAIRRKGVIIRTVVPASELSVDTLAELKQRMDAAHNDGATVVDAIPLFVPAPNSVTATIGGSDAPVDPTDAAGDPA